MYARQISNEHTKELKQLSCIIKTDKKKKSDKLFYTANGISIFFLLWILASYIDVVSHNMTTYTYAWWNLIEIFTSLF